MCKHWDTVRNLYAICCILEGACAAYLVSGLPSWEFSIRFQDSRTHRLFDSCEEALLVPPADILPLLGIDTLVLVLVILVLGNRPTIQITNFPPLLLGDVAPIFFFGIRRPISHLHADPSSG